MFEYEPAYNVCPSGVQAIESIRPVTEWPTSEAFMFDLVGLTSVIWGISLSSSSTKSPL
jgi:hypothetical protein